MLPFRAKMSLSILVSIPTYDILAIDMKLNTLFRDLELYCVTVFQNLPFEMTIFCFDPKDSNPRCTFPSIHSLLAIIYIEWER